MKLRLLALTVVLLTLIYAAPSSFAQDQGSTKPSDPSSDSTATPAPKSTPAPPAGVQPADPDKVKHDGGKTDVEAVGNRNVGCKTGLGNWYGVEKQIAMGKQYSMQVESTVKLVQDPVVSEYVNRLGQNLVRNSDAQVPFTIKVIDSEDINAFALPGGFFFVNTGILLAADNKAEMAGVMAHEIGHVAARHGTRQATKGQIVNYGTIPLIFLGGWTGYAIRQGMGLAIPMGFLTF